MGVRLNRSGLAEHMAVSLPTIDRWGKEGMPVVTRGSRGVEWVFDLADVIRWRIERAQKDAASDAPDDIQEIEKRAARAKMEMVELELAKAKGLVAPLDQIERNMARVFAEVRANMRNIPGVVISELIGETEERVFKRVLLKEIDQALSALADVDFTSEEENEEEDGSDE